jgi:urease accessory protein
VGSLAFLGQPINTELVATARSCGSGEGQIGVSRLRSGLICRYRGRSTTEARRWFIAVWQLLRAEYLQRQSCIPRVWQL